MSPIPLKESILERFAFLYEPLKIKRIFNLFEISVIIYAISNVLFSFSIAQGPAIRKNVPSSICLIMENDPNISVGIILL